ncbi:MAG: hypothetical protein AAGI37_00100 [Planctomycetota bacterium]
MSRLPAFLRMKSIPFNITGFFWHKKDMPPDGPSLRWLKKSVYPFCQQCGYDVLGESEATTTSTYDCIFIAKKDHHFILLSNIYYGQIGFLRGDSRPFIETSYMPPESTRFIDLTDLAELLRYIPGIHVWDAEALNTVPQRSMLVSWRDKDADHVLSYKTRLGQIIFNDDD